MDISSVVMSDARLRRCCRASRRARFSLPRGECRVLRAPTQRRRAAEECTDQIVVFLCGLRRMALREASTSWAAQRPTQREQDSRIQEQPAIGLLIFGCLVLAARHGATSMGGSASLRLRIANGPYGPAARYNNVQNTLSERSRSGRCVHRLSVDRLPAPHGRRNTDEFLERAAERGFGFVTDMPCGFGDVHVARREPFRGNLHPPLGQVLHRRLSDEMGESFGECRSRQPRLFRQLLERPSVRRTVVQESERAAHVRISQSHQPARLIGRQSFEVSSNDFDEHQLAQPCEHGFPAVSLVQRFGDCGMNKVAKPLCGRIPRRSDMNESWQRGQQRVERPHIAPEKAADEVDLGRTGTAVAHDNRELMIGVRRIFRDSRLRAHSRLARDDVAIAVWEDDDIARNQMHWRLVGQSGPARSVRDDVIRHQMLDARHHASCNEAAFGRLGNPRRCSLHVEEHRAGQPDGPQDIRKGVGGHSSLAGRIVTGELSIARTRWSVTTTVGMMVSRLEAARVQ
jgi:hypothetical protein